MSPVKRLALAALRWSGPAINVVLAFLHRERHPVFAALLFAYALVLGGLVYLLDLRFPLPPSDRKEP